MLLTIKLGGTSVGDAERIRSAAALVKHVRSQGHRVVVVTSAMAGVTNQLVDMVSQPPAAADDASRVTGYFRLTKKLEQDHTETARRAIRDPRLVEEVANTLYMGRHGLERILLGSHLLGELTPIGYDFVVSEGERLCVPVLAACMRDHGLDAVGLGGDEAGVVTDNNYGSSLPNEEATRREARRVLLPLLEAGKTPVVAGFYGRSAQGRIAILGRGGSDFSATLLGCALDADEIWILKHEVDGIKTTDPRLVPAAHTIPEVSYEIAAEMAMLGAKVLHPKSVQPAARQQIPVRIGTSADLSKPGTRLRPQSPGAAPGVTALTLVRKAGLVRASSPAMGDEGIIGAGFVEALRRNNIDVLASGHGFNGGRALWLLAGSDVERFLGLLRDHVAPHILIEAQRDVAILGVVGHRVGVTPGILAQVAQCLQRSGTPAVAMLQGASPNGIIVTLADDDRRLPTALRALHTELGLDREGGA
jgi:aspartate kinase